MLVELSGHCEINYFFSFFSPMKSIQIINEEIKMLMELKSSVHSSEEKSRIKKEITKLFKERKEIELSNKAPRHVTFQSDLKNTLFEGYMKDFDLKIEVDGL
jgi:valyl-tRNA synthetase